MKYRNHAVCSSLVYPYLKKKEIEANKKTLSSKKIDIEIVDYISKHNKQTTIENINLSIPYGSKVILAGKNGSGKSTLIRSILGLNDYDGQIYLNEHNLKDLDKSSVRCRIGYVPQAINLFNNTILYNILYGSINKSISEAKTLSIKINLHENIKKLDCEYYTEINDEKKSLSGGEKQKIIIARALINNPDILIMDEPFSSVDAESREIIYDYIFTEFADKTVIMILHDTSHFDRFDKIIRF